MLVTSDAKFASQRTVPRLARVRTAIAHGELRLQVQGQADLLLPLAHPAHHAHARRQVEVWGDACWALDEGDAAAAWFTAATGQPLRMVRVADEMRRQVDPRFAATGVETGFADGFPVLVINEASLAELNRALREPVTMQRFRPNVVLSGAAAWAEDAWRQVRTSTVALALVKPCARCSIVNVDPDTGLAGAEPLRTLGACRTNVRKGS